MGVIRPYFSPARLVAAGAVKDALAGKLPIGAAGGDAVTIGGVTDTIANRLAGLQSAQSAGSVAYYTLTDLNNNLSPPDGSTAQVITDGANTGSYRKTGSSGSGSWGLYSTVTLPGLDARTAPLVVAKPKGFGWALLDGLSNVPFGVRDDGTTVASAVEAGSIAGDAVTGKSVGTAGQRMTDLVPKGYADTRLDGFNRAAWGLREDGSAEVDTLYARQVVVPEATDAGTLQPELNHAAGYGQSGDLGSGAVPLLSETQPYDALMFEGGVRAYLSGNRASLVPLVERTDTVNGATVGETAMSGALQCLRERLIAENGLNTGNHVHRWLASSCGEPGRNISQLQKNAQSVDYYSRILADITAGKARADELGLTYALRVVFWDQGEGDYAAGRTAEFWKAGIDGLRRCIETDARAIAGQRETVPLILRQTATHAAQGFNGNPYIALAQLDAARSWRNVILACPSYMFDYGDTLHLTSTGQKLKGAYYGLALKRWAWDRKKFDGVRPLRSRVSGKIALVEFNVPRPPLAIDASLVAAVANAGFTLVDAAGNDLPLASVGVIGPTTVKVVAANAIPAGAKLRYAFSSPEGAYTGRSQGARGNLRDSQGLDIVFDAAGLNRPLHNYCLMFEEGLSA